MWFPQPFFQQATVLLADQHSFSAAYLAHALTALGCRVVGPFDTRQALDTWFAGNYGQVSGAILALDWLDGSHDTVINHLGGLGAPYLLVDNAPWQRLGMIGASFNWPYAAFQILEALQDIMLRSIATMETRSA